jgi:Polyketide cyclase / dehydrase and lipid transport
MLKKILVGLAAVLLVLVIVIATRPADFRVERKTTVAAPSQVVFDQINDLHAWEKWNPWYKDEPTQKLTYAGPANGKGASYSWKGEKTGSGTATIVDSKPAEHVGLTLQFTAPMESTTIADFTVKPEGDTVEVTWAMSGVNGFMGKAFSMVMDMDKMVGGSFERGLSDLKKVSEEEAKRRAAAAAEATTQPATP